VRHIKSQAHHPMTLGKIERFWKTIYEEFLVRAQFGSFEEAQERIRQWVKYYNHKRPHQGIGGLCPADRYFEIQAELRKTMEQGIAENVLEMALRGKPREPFYMVGRMEGQSVVLRAEKGKLRLMVDDEEGGGKQEMVYEVTAKEEKADRYLETIEKEGRDGKDREAEGGEAGGRGEEKTESFGIYGTAEVPCGALGLDPETQTGGGMPGVGSRVESIEPVAGAGHGGDADGVAATDFGDGEQSSIELASCGIIGAEEQGWRDERIGVAFGQTSGEPDQASREAAGSWSREVGTTRYREDLTIFRGSPDGTKRTALQEEFDRGEPKTCTGAGVGDSPGAQWSRNGKGGSEASGGIAKDLLRVGGEISQCHGISPGESSCGKTSCVCGRRKGETSGADPGVGEETLFGREDDRGQGDVSGLRYVSGPGH
jgi:hypothetical protein